REERPVQVGPLTADELAAGDDEERPLARQRAAAARWTPELSTSRSRAGARAVRPATTRSTARGRCTYIQSLPLSLNDCSRPWPTVPDQTSWPCCDERRTSMRVVPRVARTTTVDSAGARRSGVAIDVRRFGESSPDFHAAITSAKTTA